ncbi:MAG: UDP-N-acetylglucosamine 1-carboxyvinyltransferase [Bacillota bacterium]|nr:MAG: UDP-N-acetylglucosamine 1-carboxyvinyltransferase [Bacillota bacterium]
MKLVIKGRRPLTGSVKVHGAKNAVLPIIAASILCHGESVISQVPHLEDVYTAVEVMASLGVDARLKGSTLILNTGGLDGFEAPYELVRRMRASFLVTGPLLARLGHARISLPGGCAIGTRPIDLHLKGLEALGARIRTNHGLIEASASRLVGDRIYLDYPSVGATEHLMMASTLAEGTTIIENAAEEPEIVDLANYLNAAGASIHGAGTKVVRVEGVNRLQGVRHQVIPDRIEAGTYMIAAAVAAGRVEVRGVVPDHLKAITAKLREAGIQVEEAESSMLVDAIGRRPVAVNVKTMPYPGFPTDLQAPIMALLAVSDGSGVIAETVFENRYIHVDELKRMGADIRVDGRTALVRGKRMLYGAPVSATDLRGGAALVLAALAAAGVSEVRGVEHIDRGYDSFDANLRRLGASIRRVRAVPAEEKAVSGLGGGSAGSGD